MSDALERRDPDLSPARVDPIARRFIAEVESDAAVAYLQQARFRASLWSWATARAKVQLIADWVDGMPIESAANSARGQTSPLELLRKWLTTASGEAARLGLDPLSAARLGKDIAQGRQADAAAELTRLRSEHDQAVRESGDEDE